MSMSKRQGSRHGSPKNTALKSCLILLLTSHIGITKGNINSYNRHNDGYNSGLLNMMNPKKWKTVTTVAALCILSTTIIPQCVQVVTTGDECLVERLGKFHRKLGPGWHLIGRPFESVSFHVTMREQVLDVPPQQCYTLDNAPLKADAVVYMRILSSESARYNVKDVYSAVLNLCLTQLREEVGKLTLDESFSSRERINRALLRDLNVVCQTWGIEITRVEIQNLEPSPVILGAMELQMAAERKKRAAILQSEGERTTLTNEAEGRAAAVLKDAEAQRESIILAAQAESERLRMEAEGLRHSIQIVAGAIGDAVALQEDGSKGDNNNGAGKLAVDGALQLLMLVRYMETQAKFANGNGTKVLMFPTKDSIPITYEGLSSMLK